MQSRVKFFCSLLFTTLLSYPYIYAQINQHPQHLQICTNDSGVFVVVPAVNSTFIWQDSSTTGWNNIINSSIYQGVDNDTLYLLNVPYSYDGKVFRCIVDSAGLGIRKDTSRSASLTVYPLITKPILTQSQKICYNTNADTIKLIQQASGADGNFSYQWQYSSNGTNWTDLTGNTGHYYLTGSLTSSTYYRVRATSTFGCGSIVSDSVFIEVYAELNAGVIGSNQQLCYADKPDTLRFTSHPFGGGNMFTYQWQYSYDSIVFSNMTGEIYDYYKPDTLHDSRYFRVIVSSQLGCGKDTSNGVKMHVYELFHQGVIEGDDTICYNTKPSILQFNANPKGGNTPYSYQWLRFNQNTWEPVPNQTSASFQSNELITDQMFRLLVTSASNCGYDTTNLVKVTVYPDIQKALISGNQSICFNANADTIKVIQIATGADGSFAYQWQNSSNGVVWYNITGANGQYYLSPTLTSSAYYRIIASSNFGCGSIASDSIFVNVFPEIKAGIISQAQTICFGAKPDTLRFQQAPSGGGNSYNYQWQSSFSTSDYQDILTADQPDYVADTLKSSRNYRVVVTSNLGCGQDTTNVIQIYVYNLFNQGQIEKNETICYNTKPSELKFSINPSGGNTPYSYQWLKLNQNNWEPITGQSNPTLQPDVLLTDQLYRVIVSSSSNCGSDTTNTIKITVYPNLERAVIKGGQSICYNTIPDTLKTTQVATGADDNFAYQWQNSVNGLTWSNIPSANGLIYTPQNLFSSQYYRLIAASVYGCGSIASDSIFVNVYRPLNAGIIGNEQDICYNTVPDLMRFSNHPTGGGESYYYQWQISNDSNSFNDIVNASNNTFQSDSLINDAYFRLRVISEKGCGELNSNVVKIKVYQPFVKASIGYDDTVCFGFEADTLKTVLYPVGGKQPYSYQWLRSHDLNLWDTIPQQSKNYFLTGNLYSTTYYRMISSSSHECGSDTSNVVKVRVNPLPDTALIIGQSSVCRNQHDVWYHLSKDNPLYSYSWETNAGDIITSDSNKSVYVRWHDLSQKGFIEVQQINRLTGCFNVMQLPINVMVSRAPDKATIIRKPNSNYLICNDSSLHLKYQWGYVQKSDMKYFDITGANFRYVNLPHDFDTNRYIYYVKTSLDNCTTISFFNSNEFHLDVEDLQEDDIVIFPNPVRDVLFIRGIKPNTIVTIVSSEGKAIPVYFKADDENKITLPYSITDGLYVITFIYDNSVVSKKILIIR